MSENENETQGPSPLDGWDDAKLVSRFVPDPAASGFKTIADAQAAGYDTLNPVTGSFQLAVVVNGHPVVISEEQAAHVRHLTDAAKAAADAKAGGQ